MLAGSRTLRSAAAAAAARVWLLLLAMSACSPPIEDEPEPPPQAAVDAAARSDTGARGAEEYGIGLIHFDQLRHAPPRHDTLTLRATPSADAPAVAQFVFAMPSGAQWSYEVSDSTGVIQGNIIEFGYEESGIPFDSMTTDSAWVRALFDADPIRRGWAARTDRTAILFWTEHLPERAQFFLRDEFIALHASPGGARIDFPLERGSGYPSQYDYHLETDSIAGRWVRARVVTRSDACGIEADPVRDTVAWLEYLDGRGLPRVWYYSRGC